MPAPHLFTSRDLTLRDDREWAAAAGSMGVAPDRLLVIKQVHGTGVAVWRRETGLPPEGGSHSAVRHRVVGEADILLTDDPSVAIAVRTADCASVLLYDRRKGAAGAAHAGWRGAAADAAGTAVRALQREFGSEPRDLVAAIGPCLGACCGEVGPEVVEAFRRTFGAATANAWFGPGARDRSYLDLERANADQLACAGMDRDRIFASGLCTRTHRESFHSYRAEGASTGRLLAAIRLP